MHTWAHIAHNIKSCMDNYLCPQWSESDLGTGPLAAHQNCAPIAHVNLISNTTTITFE